MLTSYAAGVSLEIRSPLICHPERNVPGCRPFGLLPGWVCAVLSILDNSIGCIVSGDQSSSKVSGILQVLLDIGENKIGMIQLAPDVGYWNNEGRLLPDC